MIGITTYCVQTSLKAGLLDDAALSGLLDQLIWMTQAAISGWFGNRQLAKQ